MSNAGTAHLRFLEAMDRIERAMRSSSDLEAILRALLQRTLEIFDCDRTWVTTPLDPDAQTMSAPLTCARPGYEVPLPPPGAVPLFPLMAEEQVLINLVVNARDAMPAGGHLSIETQNVGDEAHAGLLGDRVAPPAVCLRVRDSGCGMDAETAARAFEPFYTTKALRAGAGLGLSTCYALVERAGGVIDIETAPGSGTCFSLYFPAAPAEVAREEAAPPIEAAAGGAETILLCEDDDDVRALLVESLSDAGYRVLAAEGGQSALARGHTRPIALLITDVIMPGMSGKQLSDALARTGQRFPTLFVSGYPANEISRHGVLAEDVNLLAKPFSCNDLLTRVREALR